MHAFRRVSLTRQTMTPTTADSRTPGSAIEHALHVFRKDVQPLRRDDHFLLAPADEQLTACADLADVAGVKPAVLERARASPRRRVEISAS